MTWLISKDDHREALAEIEQTKSDRATAIVAATFLEADLRNALEARLREDEKIIKKLFKPTGPLGPFQNKAELAYLMGIYDAGIRDDIISVASIRNMFAHVVKPLTFHTREIGKLCRGLRIVDSDPYPQIPGRGLPDELRSPPRIEPNASLRERFILSIKLITIALWAASHDHVLGPDGRAKRKWMGEQPS